METTGASTTYLEVRGLVKWFGDDRAVDGISFEIPRGDFLTLLSCKNGDGDPIGKTGQNDTRRGSNGTSVTGA